jgi:hypothetical protein
MEASEGHRPVVARNDPSITAYQPSMYRSPLFVRRQGGLAPVIIIEVDDRQAEDQPEASREGRLAGGRRTHNRNTVHCSSMPKSAAHPAYRGHLFCGNDH